MNKLVNEAPYHPGYEDAVITTRRSEPVYKGMDPTKMLWKPKPLSDEEIEKTFNNTFKVRDFDGEFLRFARAIEERHGIK